MPKDKVHCLDNEFPITRSKQVHVWFIIFLQWKALKFILLKIHSNHKTQTVSFVSCYIFPQVILLVLNIVKHLSDLFLAAVNGRSPLDQMISKFISNILYELYQWMKCDRIGPGLGDKSGAEERQPGRYLLKMKIVECRSQILPLNAVWFDTKCPVRRSLFIFLL